VDLYQSIFPTFDDFEYKGVQAWLWRIWWTWFAFFPVYTILSFFLHLNTRKVIPLHNSIYWWYVPLWPVMMILGHAIRKSVGIMKPNKNKSQGNGIEETAKSPKNEVLKTEKNDTPKEKERRKKDT